MESKSNITGLILAGGAGRRVGQRDKGLIPWQGKPLIAHVSSCLRPQVGELLISCNRNFSCYEKFATQTVSDHRQDFQGPLAGLEAASSVILTDFLVVVSCDMPSLPPDLVTRLIAPLYGGGNGFLEISYAHDGVRAQYLCAVIRRDCLKSLTPYLDTGHRAVQDWYKSRHAISVDFSDNRSSFRNYNKLK
jgi:molybdopterin-guanine dinucleotide biosynthesis protein A